MSPPKIKHIGRVPGSANVPRECYAGIVLLHVLFDWTYYDIGRPWKAAPDTIRNICKRWERA